MIAISDGARLYALWELSRRAGVTFELFEQWKIELRADAVVVRPGQDCFGEIHFPRFHETDLQATKVVEKQWSHYEPEKFGAEVPNLVVPFARCDSVSQQPLFVGKDQAVFVCTEDLLASIVLTLSRYEEIVSPERDAHGRFPASASIAGRHGFLNRPIVDEYGLAFQQLLEIMLPRWQPLPRRVRVKVSHDIDLLGIPFNLKAALGHPLTRAAPLSCVRDLSSIVSSLEPTYLSSVRTLCELSTRRGVRSALYWKGSAPGRFDTGYDLTNLKISRVIDWAKERGVEMGVHPGYETFLARDKLRAEVERCREALQQTKIGGRQHYLRWCPATWEDWEGCDLAYDSSVGFADQIGFRAGTCIPYVPWLWTEDRAAELLEIPLLCMDGTIVQHLKLSPAESLRAVRELVERCTGVGGVFTLLWHNSSLLRPYGQHYVPILDLLRSIETYDWEKDAAELRRQARQLRERRYLYA